MWETIKIISSSVWRFALPFLRRLLTGSGTILLTSALSAVKMIADSGIGSSGAEKRELAYHVIAEDLKGKGITLGVEVSTSMINAAIELAVQKLKAD
ncbi:MAG: phage holin, LLH family [Desulfuromonadaceae bacterium]|nr:phage holin, LLH family [Desulfuromonadaceae bacterium]